MNNDLISREALKRDIMSYKTMPEIRKAICEVIDDAPTVETPQGELANEVWKLYEKHQPYLATRVIEFGDELKELLGKYQKGGNK